MPLAWSFPRDGLLDLLPAGRQDPTYAMRVNSFNWSGFYDRLGGGVFLEAVKQNMRKRYDYILIDSRTGVSDTAGVCTVQMPDVVVVCFTYNIQSIEGGAAVAASIKAQRDAASGTIGASTRFQIFPVPMRVEGSEKAQLDRARNFAQSAFGGFIEHLPGQRCDDYWGEIYVPYEPFYAYHEILATIADEPGLRGSILTSFERLAEFVTDEKVIDRSPAQGSERQELKELFLSGGPPRTLAAVLSHYPEFQAFVDKVIVRQKSWMQTGRSDEYLLGPHHIKRLGKSIELLVAMLQDKDFRDFWEFSQKRLRQRAVWRFRLKQVVAFVGASLLLAALAIDHYGWLESYPVVRSVGMSALAGILGAITWSLIRDTSFMQTQTAPDELLFWFRLPMGAVLGVMVAVIVPVVAPAVVPIAFLAGFSLSTIEKLESRRQS